MRRREQNNRGKKWEWVLHPALETLEGETLLEYDNIRKYMSNIMQAPLEVFWERWVHKDNNNQRM